MILHFKRCLFQKFFFEFNDVRLFAPISKLRSCHEMWAGLALFFVIGVLGLNNKEGFYTFLGWQNVELWCSCKTLTFNVH